MAYYPGLNDARETIRKQSLQEDLRTLDSLFGRDNLRYGATPEEVKEEALRQLQKEFTVQTRPGGLGG